MDDPIDETSRWRRQIDRALPFAIGISLMLAIGALLYFASQVARQQQTALAEQQRSYEIVTLVRRLDASLAKAESSLARYVISMDKDIGRQYQDQWNMAGKELTALRFATRGDVAERHLVDELIRAYQQRGLTLNDIALRTTYDQKQASLGKFYQASQAPSLGRLTLLMERLIGVENDRLREHNLDVARSGTTLQQLTTTYRLVGLALLITILLLAWVARTGIHERRQEQRMIDDEYHRALALEAAVAARTDELEQAYTKLQRESADRARMEESLRQMQKMEAVGQLTGGIAHDFNNMLAVVIGGLELSRRRLEDRPDIMRYIDNAMEGANRAAALTRRLLTFARAEPTLPAMLEPDAIIRDMVDLVDRSIGDQITVELDLQAPDWAIFADRHQLENALLNLVVNARDAMDGRGRVILRSRPARLQAQEVARCAAGEYVCLSVVDNGCGMTPEVLEHVFEPFFTTKAVGKGTGLGLSQIFGFVGQIGGDIRILSEPGKGTEVQLYLPRHRAAREAAGPRPTAPTMPASAAEAAVADARGLHILLVEDDPRVLSQTRAALAELGHDTLACDRPEHAAALLDEHPGIDLILSDVLMPGMTGPEMVSALPAAHRSIPVVFVTGFTGDAADSRLFEGHKLLRKPYTLHGLKQAILEATGA